MAPNVTETFPRAGDPDVFPPSVSIYSVTIPADAVENPGGPEVALPEALRHATAKRRIEFLAGRYCARRAMKGLAAGALPEAPPQDADGCPVWPPGIVGSISHTDQFATAAVVSSSGARGLGVDVEPVMSSDAAAELARLVASEDETRRVRQAADLTVAEALTLVFSAKESLYKALFPPMRQRFDYLDCEIIRVDRNERRFVACFRPPFEMAFGRADFEGRYELIDDEVRTGVVVPLQTSCPERGRA
jgi:enterobactin synthetase component D